MSALWQEVGGPPDDVALANNLLLPVSVRPASTGITCPWRLVAAAARPASVVYVTGSRQAYGQRCTATSLNTSIRRVNSTSRACLDSAIVASPCGGQDISPDPINRGKLGCTRHLVVDGHGVPLAVVVSAANVHDRRMFEPVLDAVVGIRNGRCGRLQRRSLKLHADKGYDDRRCRHAYWKRGIRPRIARRGVESSSTLGRHRLSPP
ncbi:transposase [Deinococcus pimensis]|uniref:transposase n=1 Tax=Deinococcus pimensis TaxID=309888 RepID=UPI003CCBD5E6